MAAICELNNITKWFPPNHLVFNHMNLIIDENEKVLIMGAAGSGRTSLIQLISGVMQTDEGAVLHNGRIAVIPEVSGWAEPMTMREHLILPLLGEGCPWKQAMNRAGQMMERLGLSGRGNVRPKQMSAYEKALVSAGQALLQNSRMIAADTFMSRLSMEESERLAGILTENLADRALLMMSDRQFACPIFDRVINIEELQHSS